MQIRNLISDKNNENTCLKKEKNNVNLKVGI